MDPDMARQVIDVLRGDAARCYDNYLSLLNETEDGEIRDPDRIGVARSDCNNQRLINDVDLLLGPAVLRLKVSKHANKKYIKVQARAELRLSATHHPAH